MRPTSAMRHALTLLAGLALAAAARPAAGDPAPTAPAADPGGASPPPPAPTEAPTEARLFTAPTAWLPPAGAITASASLEQSLEHHDDGAVTVGYGLGGLAAIELGADTEIRTCTRCGEPANARWFPRASFRLGARQDAWFRGMPALALGLKNTFAARGFGGFERPRVTEAYVVASHDAGRIRVHGGAMAIAAAFGELELAPAIRPIAGFELRPPGFPRSMFVADVAWTTRLELEPEPSARRGPRLEMMIGAGARHQFFGWAAIELGVRFPREEGLDGGRVMIRLTGIWERATPGKRRLELR